MTEFNESIGLVQSQNKARSYDSKVGELQREVTGLRQLVTKVKEHLVWNIEQEATFENFEVRADSAQLLHKIEDLEKKVK
tara:strand:- start:1478 stop:1717 length:240 start_codon:yes stop_codon:yes gene_type:complete